MAAIERAIDQARERAERVLVQVGREVRAARVNRGLSQLAVGTAAGLAQAQVSRIERHHDPGVTIDALARLSTSVGLELSVKLYPAGQPLRDKAHMALRQAATLAATPSC